MSVLRKPPVAGTLQRLVYKSGSATILAFLQNCLATQSTLLAFFHCTILSTNLTPSSSAVGPWSPGADGWEVAAFANPPFEDSQILSVVTTFSAGMKGQAPYCRVALLPFTRSGILHQLYIFGQVRGRITVLFPPGVMALGLTQTSSAQIVGRRAMLQTPGYTLQSSYGRTQLTLRCTHLHITWSRNYGAGFNIVAAHPHLF